MSIIGVEVVDSFEQLFGCNDTAILVKSNCKELIMDLNRIYGSYYSDVCKESYVLNFCIGQCPGEYKIVDREDNDNTDNYIEVENNSLTIYMDNYDNLKKQFAKRIFTNSFVRVFQNNGYTIVHGACVEGEDGLTLIVGDKGSGKTTTLIYLLRNNFKFISNDKVAIKEVDGQTVGCGIPFSMGINMKDFSKCFDTSEYYNENGKVYLKICDIANIFNTQTKCKGILKKILVTNYDTEIDESLEKISNIVQMIDSNILYNAVSDQKQYLNDLIGVDNLVVDQSFLNNINGYYLNKNAMTTEKSLIKMLSKI